MSNDDRELWISDDDADGDFEAEDTWDPEDPTFFQLGLQPEGNSGKFHLSRSGGQRVRAAVSSRESGSKVPPAFRVSSAAKLIVHGTIDEETEERATLLVHEFTFLSHRSTRIKEAAIELKFQSHRGRADGRPDGPLVEKVAPFGGHEMLEISRGQSAGVDDARLPLVGGGARVFGERPTDDFGHSEEVNWSIKENLNGGIPWRLRTCVLLKRQSDDNFCLQPIIRVLPDLTLIKLDNLLSTGPVTEPIVFDPEYEPFDELEGSLRIDRWNLGSVDLDTVWGWDYQKGQGAQV